MHMASFQKKFTTNTLFREKSNDKGLFLKRIGTLIEEGYSIKDALDFLSKIEKGKSTEWIKQIQTGLLTGDPFHKELEKAGFSDRICGQIYLAAQYGNYGETIRQCGEQLLANNKRQEKLRGLATYPILLLCFLIGMLLLMRVLVFPHMEALMQSMSGTASISNNWIVDFVYYSPQILLGVLSVLLITILAVKHYLKKKTIIQKIDYYIKIPLIKVLLKDYYSHFFFFEWAQLFNNGCSFQEIIQIMQGDDSSTLLKETGQHLSKMMLFGYNIHEAVQTLPYFYEEGVLVITHGETLGKLGVEMAVYADYCEQQLNNRIEQLMSQLQPIIFSLVGLMIVAIYAALMLPIFTMMEGW